MQMRDALPYGVEAHWVACYAWCDWICRSDNSRCNDSNLPCTLDSLTLPGLTSHLYHGPRFRRWRSMWCTITNTEDRRSSGGCLGTMVFG